MGVGNCWRESSKCSKEIQKDEGLDDIIDSSPFNLQVTVSSGGIWGG